MFQSIPAHPSISVSRLIVTADDLGHSASRNSAILQSLRHGYVTHASLLVNLEGFEEACDLVHADRFEAVIGLHLNLTDGPPLTEAMKQSRRFTRDGHFRFPLQGRGIWPLSADDHRIVYEEVMAQLGRARAAGFSLSHLDSHHHVHLEPVLARSVLAAAAAHGIRRVRRLSNTGPKETLFRRMRGAVSGRLATWMGCELTRYFGDLDDMRWMVAHRKPMSGALEIMTHPNLGDGGAIIDGKDRELLSMRLLQFRPYVPQFIDGAGRVKQPACA